MASDWRNYVLTFLGGALVTVAAHWFAIGSEVVTAQQLEERVRKEVSHAQEVINKDIDQIQKDLVEVKGEVKKIGSIETKLDILLQHNGVPPR